MTPSIKFEYDSARFHINYQQTIRNTGALVEGFNTIVAMKSAHATKETTRLYELEILDMLDKMRPLFENGTVSRVTGSDGIQVNLQRILADCPLTTEILARARELKKENSNYRFTVLVGEMDFIGKGGYVLTRIVTVHDGDDLNGFISTGGSYLSPERIPRITDPISSDLPITENPIRTRLSGRSGLLDRIARHGY